MVRKPLNMLVQVLDNHFCTILDCNTCTMKRHDSSRRVSPKLKKLAKLNLMSILNEDVTKSMDNFLQTDSDLIQIHRDKIKTDYHYMGTGSNNGKSIRKGNCENVCRIEFSSKEFSPNKPSLRERLKEFARKHNPPSDMFQDMLQLMQDSGVTIPHNIFDSLPMFDILQMTFGQYINFGILRNLQNFIKKKIGDIELSIPEELKLDIAIYMIKTKPDENNLKPPHYLLVLGRIRNGHFTEPFVIGIYKGAFPSLIIGNQILKPLYTELKSFETNQVQLIDQMCKIVVNSVICDPITNSIVTCTSLPDSTNGCSKCHQQGQLQFTHGITSYPASATPGYSRNDDDFKICIQNGHHIGVPIFSELKLGLISQFVIDYKSFVCEGVMQRLMKLWTKGKLDYRLNKESLRKISAELMLIGNALPKEFKRKPKIMDELEDWTAYDYRQFLIYYGPIVLKTVLPTKYYLHFIVLHLAVRLSISREDLQDYGTFLAGQFLAAFTKEFAILYGSEYIDYNIHNLLHIEDVAMRLGPLDSVSGFAFDKQTDLIQNMIKDCWNKRLPEMGNEILENTKTLFENRANEMMTKLPYVPKAGILVTEKFTLTTTFPDDHAIVKEGVVKIEAICCEDGEIEIIGKLYKNNGFLYHAPATHQKLLIVSELSDTKTLQVEDILLKGVAINTTRGLCIQPFVNF